jgi:hypothetical protein
MKKAEPGKPVPLFSSVKAKDLEGAALKLLLIPLRGRGILP